ncbi:hypothetical protein EYF80_043601 [Liparis tanakae]|uniref:Uncharacterized protein n=1 Tax=Liparis tanakae TaxID=230148 RepID=A0A4Z2G119_9TELE|nr:hypothetical protein EYF80_043601 [Liparis tanakae]
MPDPLTVEVVELGIQLMDNKITSEAGGGHGGNNRRTVRCLVRSGSSSGKDAGRLSPSLSLPSPSDDVPQDGGWTGGGGWICGGGGGGGGGGRGGWPWGFLSLLWWASSPLRDGADTSWVFFTLKNTGEGGLFSRGLNTPTGAGAERRYHLFLALELAGALRSAARSSLGSMATPSGAWLHSLCFCRRPLVANMAAQWGQP